MASTLIGQGITVEGEITADDEVVVQGTVRGRINGRETVVVEQGAVVEADVTAANIVVGGQVTGNVTVADRIDLQTGGRLVGDVKAARITIADGASFKGNVDMEV
jgi:cytoskeletal protein CcmA (bactofilin family)